MTPLPDKYLNQIICGDALGVLREMPSDSVQSCVTSPPLGAGGRRFKPSRPDSF